MSIQLKDGLANQPFEHVLEDLLVRFLVNVPDEDLSSIERIFFQVEEAQWFYSDYIRQLNPQFPSMRMKSFAPKLLKKCPLIWKWGEPADAIARFGKYKSTIPVRGVAIFNTDLTKLLLVKGTESSTWSFPRGKISKDELDIECAIREVNEEIGFDARPFINENDVLERTIGGKNFKIYLARGVPEDTKFLVAKNEISQIAWYSIKSISKNIQSFDSANQYFIVQTVLKPMLNWISKQKGIVNEHQLIVEAEFKLKELLGVSSVVQSDSQSTQNDAGRELLNILQSGNNVTPSSIPQFMQPNLIPINLQTPFPQFPYFGNPSYSQQSQQQQQQPYFMPAFPPINGFASQHAPPTQQGSDSASVPPFQQQQQQQQQPVHQQDKFTAISVPNPQTFQKPTVARRSSEANSKELLSILNLGGSKKSNGPSTQSEDLIKNRSKAQLLLDLVNKNISKTPEQKPKKIQILRRPEQESEKTNSLVSSLLSNPPPSNSASEAASTVEEVASASKTPEPSIVKKKVTLLKRPTADEKNSANDILQILGSKPSPILQNERPTKANELLNLLKPKQLPQLPQQPSIESASVASEPLPTSSNELLNLLRQPKQAPAPVLEPKAEPVQTSSNELLNLLHRPSSDKEPKLEPQVQSKPQSDDKPKEDDFEDFEDFEDFNHSHNIRNSITNDLFDVDSDEEYVGSTEEVPQPSIPVHSNYSFSNPERRISLQPQDLFASNGSPQTSKPNLDGKELLNLLNNPNHSKVNSIHNVYGNGTVANEAAQIPIPIPISQSNQSASQNLLSILGKGPSKPAPVSLEEIESRQPQQPVYQTYQQPLQQFQQQPFQQPFQQQQFQQQFQQQQPQFQQQTLPQQQIPKVIQTSNPLLDMLHNPTANQYPSSVNQQTQNDGNSPAKDLLSILKGGKI